MRTIIVSAITSVVVCLFTFILGLKSGKNQTDRAFLQNLYKQLYAHFSEIEMGIKEKRPKRWEDFKSITKGNTTRFYPDVREMERTGDILYLKHKIAQQSLQLELDCLSYKHNVDKLCLNLHDFLINHEELFKNGINDASHDRNNKSFRRVQTDNPTGCNTHRIISYDVMLDKEKMIKLLESSDNDEGKCAISFTMRGNPPEREFVLYPGSLAVENSTFIEIISKRALEELNCAAIEKDLLKRIDVIKRKLAKRAKDPTSFWETFVGAFIDIFR